jgi:putative DNA methylase
MPHKKKLIEVALPLEAINAASKREKSIRHGHPSTLHLWWARRPLATCRAVLFAQLVDDPSSHPEAFPTPEAQEKERQRLFEIIKDLVQWENSNNEDVLNKARAEIKKYTGDNPPPVLDPFAGGGSIPLEAQRLGLEAHAGDLNPVAVLINKALIEIPPRFAGLPAVNPKSRGAFASKDVKRRGAAGLAEDVRCYGEWMKEEAYRRIGHLYPKAKLPEGGEATVIAWIWARTVKCPNPACGAEMPLVRSFELSKKSKKEAYIEPVIEKGAVSYTVKRGKGKARDGTVNRKGATCICCGSPVGFPYIRGEGKAGRMGARLMAVVADGPGGRTYLPPDRVHVEAADVPRPSDYPDCDLPVNPRDFKTPNYGLTRMADLFTPRQLTALVTFSDLVCEAQAKAEVDAAAAGWEDDGIGLDEGGSGARAYGEAVAVYLAFVVDKLTDYGNAVCSWNAVGEKMRNVFTRQAIPMVWDYAESNIFCNSSGSFNNMLMWVEKSVRDLQPNNYGVAKQCDATENGKQKGIVISTDPPYYDNIGYADLSDFFYIWLRRSLKNIYPGLFATMLVPKAEELVATPYRFENSREKAGAFFEEGMKRAFSRMREATAKDIPVTVYYAFKQREEQDGENGAETASTGWETMLSALLQSGFSITGTWPMRTERVGRTVSIGTNALASSIVIVCRPRAENAGTVSRRDFNAELRRELRVGLKALQSGSVAPVDLPQASIGPGMAVFSKYEKVLETDGSPMTVRAALALINRELDAFLSEQDGDMEAESRFCITWFEQYGLDEGDFGEADNVARARNASLDELVRDGVILRERGKVRILRQDELPENWNAAMENTVFTATQHLVRALQSGGGIGEAASLLADMRPDMGENAKALAYRLFTLCEKKGMGEDAMHYNALVLSWPEIVRKAGEIRSKPTYEQTQLI